MAVLDKAGLDVSGSVTGLGSSVGTGSGETCSTSGAGRGSIVFLKTVSNTNWRKLVRISVGKFSKKLIAVFYQGVCLVAEALKRKTDEYLILISLIVDVQNRNGVAQLLAST
ncbi:hypothetical protein Tco_1448045 [Tanacetum coccineum]